MLQLRFNITHRITITVSYFWICRWSTVSPMILQMASNRARTARISLVSSHPSSLLVANQNVLMLLTRSTSEYNPDYISIPMILQPRRLGMAWDLYFDWCTSFALMPSGTLRSHVCGKHSILTDPYTFWFKSSYHIILIEKIWIAFDKFQTCPNFLPKR